MNSISSGYRNISGSCNSVFPLSSDDHYKQFKHLFWLDNLKGTYLSIFPKDVLQYEILPRTTVSGLCINCPLWSDPVCWYFYCYFCPARVIVDHHSKMIVECSKCFANYFLYDQYHLTTNISYRCVPFWPSNCQNEKNIIMYLHPNDRKFITDLNVIDLRDKSKIQKTIGTSHNQVNSNDQINTRKIVEYGSLLSLIVGGMCYLLYHWRQ